MKSAFVNIHDVENSSNSQVYLALVAISTTLEHILNVCWDNYLFLWQVNNALAF